MPVIRSVEGSEVFTKAISPLRLLVALKLVTVLALFRVVPVLELVVNKAPFSVLVVTELTAEIAPVVLVSEILPLVLSAPPFKVILRPAVRKRLPELLPRSALTRMSLEPPVAAKVMLPEPPVEIVLPMVSVPLAFS